MTSAPSTAPASGRPLAAPRRPPPYAPASTRPSTTTRTHQPVGWRTHESRAGGKQRCRAVPRGRAQYVSKLAECPSPETLWAIPLRVQSDSTRTGPSKSSLYITGWLKKIKTCEALARGTANYALSGTERDGLGQLFAKVDADGDGGVDLLEFQAFLEAMARDDDQLTVAIKAKSTGEGAAAVRLLFGSEDEDGNGRLSRREFDAALVAWSAEVIAAGGTVDAIAEAEEEEEEEGEENGGKERTGKRTGRAAQGRAWQILPTVSLSSCQSRVA